MSAHGILDEQREMLVSRARRELIQQKSIFAILADESSDVAKKEQLYFSIRTCSDKYEVSEDFFGIYECSDGLSSDALLGYIKDILIRTSLDGKKMAAMDFDGGASMKSFSQKLKTKIAPNATFIALPIAMSSLLRMQSRTATCRPILLICANRYMQLLVHIQSVSYCWKKSKMILIMNRTLKITKSFDFKICQQQSGQLD